MLNNYWMNKIKEEEAKVLHESTFDFDDALGDTLKEKFESVYIECIKVLQPFGHRCDLAMFGSDLGSLFTFWQPSNSNKEIGFLKEVHCNFSKQTMIAKCMPNNQGVFFTKNGCARIIVENLLI
jgi:hypothetical protein